MALWFLYETRTIEPSNEITPSTNLDHGSMDGDNLSFLTENLNDDNEDPFNSDENINKYSEYPPKRDSDLEFIIEYIHTFKRYSKIDLDKTDGIDFRTRFPDKKIIPVEIECAKCKIPLEEPLRVNKNAFVYTFHGKTGPFNSFVKKCPSCSMFYRYQECTDGIHNVDDNLFIEISFLKFLKGNLQEHNTIGGTIKALNDSRKKKDQIKIEKIRIGYSMFDVLSTFDYEFSCVKCGHHPDILVADLNRKVAFRCNMEDIEDVDDPEDETAGDVECGEFWKKVECGILAEAFSNNKLQKYTIKPSFKNWSPYMGKNTKKKSHKELKAVAKDMKMTHLSGKSKFDILNDLKNNFSEKQENFGKLFLKLGGFSGGYLTYNCIHGVSYYLKMPIRAEGPRDYIDGMLCMKQPPKVTVIDMPHHLVRHSKNRQSDILRTNSGNSLGELFYPFDGRAGDHEDPETMRLAMENNFETSFPCINEVNPEDTSTISLALFDRLHENNSNSKIENLRKLKCVKELYGTFNSQVAEQLHKSFNSNKRFLNAMSPHHFIFNLRSLINHRNVMRNEKIINFERSQGYKHFQDKFGRIHVNLGFHKNFVASPSANHTNGTNEIDNVDFHINSRTIENVMMDTNAEENIAPEGSGNLAESSNTSEVFVTKNSGVINLNEKKLHINSKSFDRVRQSIREKLVAKSLQTVKKSSKNTQKAQEFPCSSNDSTSISIPNANKETNRNIFDILLSETSVKTLNQGTEVKGSSCFLSHRKDTQLVKCNACGDNMHHSSFESHKNCVDLPDLILEKFFEKYCSDSDHEGSLKTIKLVCKKWKNVAELERVTNFAKLGQFIRKIESKPEYQDVLNDVYQAAKWLLRTHDRFVTFPRLPTIVFCDDSFLQVVRSFLITNQPDKTYNNIECYDDERRWYFDCMKNIRSKCAFIFDHREDMDYMMITSIHKGINIDAIGPPTLEDAEDDSHYFRES